MHAPCIFLLSFRQMSIRIDAARREADRILLAVHAFVAKVTSLLAADPGRPLHKEADDKGRAEIHLHLLNIPLYRLRHPG